LGILLFLFLHLLIFTLPPFVYFYLSQYVVFAESNNRPTCGK
jgi:hypothetical protein